MEREGVGACLREGSEHHKAGKLTISPHSPQPLPRVQQQPRREQHVEGAVVDVPGRNDLKRSGGGWGVTGRGEGRVEGGEGDGKEGPGPAGGGRRAHGRGREERPETAG